MDAVGIKGRVALAGIAVGGAIALHAAVRFPERVTAAVVSSLAATDESLRKAAIDETLATLDVAAAVRYSTLVVHGLLHLLGHDHEVDSGEMLALQDELVDAAP